VKNKCVPTMFQPLPGRAMVGTPCPAPSRWCLVTCPADRRPRSLFALWLRHYQNEGRPPAEAADLARRTCRAHYRARGS